MKLSKYSIQLFLFTLLIIITSCSTTRHLKDNECLLTRNTIKIDRDKNRIDTKELKAYLKQRPNKRLFNFFRIKLWAYHKGSRGKDTKFNNWLKNTIGEPPVIYDSLLRKESAHEIELFLNNLGYFNARVMSSGNHFKKKKVEVIYNVNPSEAYQIRNLTYEIDDPVLTSYVFSDTAYSLLKQGMFYNVYTMDEERDRITSFLNNHGYYEFTNDYIIYEVDSSLNSHQLDITLKINNVPIPSKSQPGQVDSVYHSRFYINKIFINPDFDPVLSKKTTYDTLTEVVHQIKKYRPPNYYYFLHQGTIRVKPKTITQSIFIEDKQLFSLKDVKQTYRRFANLSIFNYINIHFSEVGNDSLPDDLLNKKLNCQVNLSRAPLQSYSIETEGTNSGGDLGIGLNVTYLNKNIFRGGEVLRISVNGSVEAQKTSSSAESQKNTFLFFNTYETGCDVSITFPKFLIPIKQERFPKYFMPMTTINTGFNSMKRPSYKRNVFNVSFGYDWDESDTKHHIIKPIDISLVKVFPTEDFAKDLEKLNDPRLKDQYTDHLISAMKYSFIFNNQDIRKLKNFIFFRGNLETCGNILNLIDHAVDAPKDTSGHFTLFNIRYAQYVRTDFDFRYYIIINKFNSIVFRSVFGIGIPYSNADALPFERGFYLGGANGMRGWRFRSLGPGAYPGTDDNLDMMGDIMIEENVEYRFPIYKFFKGALFVDVGNVWLIHEDISFPGGQIKAGNILSELAIDAGLGLRLDFNFFIFRVDGALKFRAPSEPSHKRWVIKNTGFNKILWNFGIGYPF